MKILEATLSHGSWMWGSFSRFQIPRYGKALFLALDLRQVDVSRLLYIPDVWNMVQCGCVGMCVELVEEMSASDKLI